MGPPSTAAHAPLQQSIGMAHDSPAGRQPGPAIAHLPPLQTPPQQSAATAQVAPARAQDGAAQTVVSPELQPSEQQAPARAQACPPVAQPAGLRQTSRPEPAGSAPQENEQQSPADAQG